MAGQNNIIQIKSKPDPIGPLPITNNGYQFTNWGEYREVLWLVSDGTFDSLEDYANVTRRLLAKVEKEAKAKRAKAQRTKSISKSKVLNNSAS